MYIIMAFIGRDLAGARATSHDFLSLSVSVSSEVGTFREVIWDWVLDEGVRWKRMISLRALGYLIRDEVRRSHS